MTRHLFLIGFMGSGKTHWGKILAKRLGCLFLDLDEFIETNEGRTISEIFSLSGENGFRLLERDYLRHLAALPPVVVATGGGTPCFFDNMDWMKQHGLTIYQKTPPELLFDRLKNERVRRPLLKDLDDDGLRIFILERMESREHFYRQADVILEQTKDNTAIFEGDFTFQMIKKKL
jgi:shikimate kinase